MRKFGHGGQVRRAFMNRFFNHTGPTWGEAEHGIEMYEVRCVVHKAPKNGQRALLAQVGQLGLCYRHMQKGPFINCSFQTS